MADYTLSLNVVSEGGVTRRPLVPVRVGIVELASPKSPNRAWREWFAPLLPDVLREIESGQRFIEVRWWQYLYEQMELIPFAVRNGTVFGLGIAQSRGENGMRCDRGNWLLRIVACGRPGYGVVSRHELSDR